MLKCASCGGDNPEDNRFCDECGSPLAVTCSDCGASIRAGKLFCGQCGAPVPPSHADPGAAPVESVGLRWVSVLFVDLVGFTSWSEGQDPADVREVLSGYFEVARSVVAAHGGRLEKFIGDAVMAVWGADVAHADDAQRAVRAGLEVVSGVAAFGVSRDLELVARGGVVTGEVAAWAVEGEGLVSGDRVNTAARVQSTAAPGQVLVDEATHQATRDVVEFSDAGWFEVKGKAVPLHLWRAVRAVGLRGGAATGTLVEAPLVGRVRELGLIKELFSATVEDARPRVVLASGGQGVGKSRLVGEFVTYLDGLAFRVFWHEGRCASYGSVAFGAWAQMVRQRFQLAENAPKEQITAALTDMLPGWVPDEDERRFVAIRLGLLLGTI
ncbi:MAG: zinc ribbon domain-containing protein, partial [Nocardioidaceae bacterium]|nr:zinc ribbon domain-containing protein [Nocardioidaceae bacterium]